MGLPKSELDQNVAGRHASRPVASIELGANAAAWSARTGVPGAATANYMARRGRRIIEGCGALWHSTEGGFLMSCPYEMHLDPDPEELKQMLRAARAAGARFSSGAWPGLASGVYLCRQPGYSLSHIDATFRRKVRRASEQLQVRLVEPAELLEQGLQLNRDTMERQGRHDAEFGDAKQWKRLVDASYSSPGISVVGAFRRDRLAVYMILCREGRVSHILHQNSRTADLKSHPNHFLTFEVTRQCLEDPDIDFVSYGLGSLVRAPGLHDYKLRFRYEFSPVNSVLVLHPHLAPILASAPARFVAGLASRLRPRDQRLERVATVLHGAKLSQRHFAVRRSMPAAESRGK